MVHFATSFADWFTRKRPPAGLSASDRDVYLSPHCDDIAFSLGSFAAARGAGRLVTVFTYSNFTLDPGLADLSPAAVTEWRWREEQKFAAACGMTQTNLGMQEAPLRGRPAMDYTRAGEELAAFSPVILPALLDMQDERPAALRPWLFAPMGLGGHLDHAIILQLIAVNRAALARRFRVAFYEDLPYASWYHERVMGLARFRALFGRLVWRRMSFPLGSGIEAKLDLVNLYGSQHRTSPVISDFSPHCQPPQPPHEAVWISDDA
jgi:LmbE family N-acetylglucosaminyl deacetylase